MLDQFGNAVPIDNPRIAYEPCSQDLFAVVTWIQPQSTDTNGDYTGIVYLVRSEDEGQTWSSPVAMSGTDCLGGNITVDGHGGVFVVWQDLGTSHIKMRRSTDCGVTFAEEEIVGVQVDNRGTAPPAYSAYNRRDPIYGDCTDMSADFPTIVARRNSPNAPSEVHVAWAERKVGQVELGLTSRYEVEPNDHDLTATPVPFGTEMGGEVWSGDFTSDHEPEYDLFQFAGAAGDVIVMTGEILQHWPPPYIPDLPARCTRITVYSGPDTVQLVPLTHLDMLDLGYPLRPSTIMTLPRTGRYFLEIHAASDYNHRYRFRLQRLVPDAASVARDHRDIVITSSLDGGTMWGEKRRLAEESPYFDECLPSLAFDSAGVLHAAWYGRRDDTNGFLVNTYWAFSADRGTSFTAPVRVSTQSSGWNFNGIGPGIDAGNHLGLAPLFDGMVVAWTQQVASDVEVHGSIMRAEAVPVAGVSLSAAWAGGGIDIRWTIDQPDNFTGVFLERTEAEGTPAVRIPDRPLPPGQEFYRDDAVQPERDYTYDLVLIDRMGNEQRSGPVRVLGLGSRPLTPLRWSRIGPNPFSTQVDLDVEGDPALPVTLAVFDTSGRLVRKFDSVAPSGSSARVTWDGRDAAGRRVSSGTYFVRAWQEGGAPIETKVSVLR